MCSLSHREHTASGRPLDEKPPPPLTCRPPTQPVGSPHFPPLEERKKSVHIPWLGIDWRLHIKWIMVESFETRSLVGFLSILHHLIVRNCETATDSDWLLFACLDDIKTNFRYFFASSLAQMSCAKKPTATWCHGILPGFIPSLAPFCLAALVLRTSSPYHVIPLLTAASGIAGEGVRLSSIVCHCRHLTDTHKNKGRLATLLINTAQALSSSDKMTFG